MAFEKKSVMPAGVELDKSYWRVSQVILNANTETASIDFLGYVSREARKNGKAPFSTKSYQLSKEESEPFLKAAKEGNPETNLFKMAYDFAFSRKDQVVNESEEQVSFFSNAVEA